ncbi:hypothetical protein H3V17_03635 [Bartonella sp. M0283]|uniref:hypothetical protein n=1 Tax=Bartonella sp. M0283 TaxID=2751016 RepID=UPI0018DC8E49|nr:hypothetical protein [Bartonella sp. M0283]MBI0162736.1 hypothetical protein [Bartonella sp. M0283]
MTGFDSDVSHRDDVSFRNYDKLVAQTKKFEIWQKSLKFGKKLEIWYQLMRLCGGRVMLRRSITRIDCFGP